MNEMITINKFKGVVEFKMRIINFSLKFVMMAKQWRQKQWIEELEKF
jgi:hypothetical protein